MVDQLLSTTDALYIGGLTGAIEASVNLPLWVIKTRVQCGLPFTYNPCILYRGYPVAVLSMAAITAVQVSNSSNFQHVIENSNEITVKRVCASFMGGATSALIFGPIDLVATQQHKHNYRSFLYSYYQTVQKIGYKGLFRGAPSTAIAEGVFTSSFFGIYPFLKKEISQSISDNKTSSLMAGVSSGIFAGVASQPADLIKTLQQKDADNNPGSIKKYVKDLYSKKNGAGFFKGFVSRTIWLTSAVTVTGVVSEYLEANTLQKRM